VVAFGDSHTLHWLAAFDEAGRRSGWRVVAFAKPSCSSFLFPASADCDRFRRKAAAFIRRAHPALVVFSNSGYRELAQNGAGMEAPIRAAVRQVPRGIPVAVLSQTPKAAANVPVCLSAHLHETSACEPRRNVANNVNRHLRAALRGTNARLVDAAPLVCDGAACPSVVGNVLVYRDQNHVTYDFARMRAGALIRMLSPLIGGATPTGEPRRISPAVNPGVRS
jgi:hypothetical protein